MVNLLICFTPKSCVSCESGQSGEPGEIGAYDKTRHSRKSGVSRLYGDSGEKLIMLMNLVIL